MLIGCIDLVEQIFDSALCCEHRENSIILGPDSSLLSECSILTCYIYYIVWLSVLSGGQLYKGEHNNQPHSILHYCDIQSRDFSTVTKDLI